MIGGVSIGMDALNGQNVEITNISLIKPSQRLIDEHKINASLWKKKNFFEI